MTTGRTAAPGAGGQEVIQLHERWLRILDRLTGAPIGHGPRISNTERANLITQARALERQIADAKARTIAEAILKIKMAACPFLISGGRTQLVESVARDLQAPDFGNPQAGADNRDKRRT